MMIYNDRQKQGRQNQDIHRGWWLISGAVVGAILTVVATTLWLRPERVVVVERHVVVTAVPASPVVVERQVIVTATPAAMPTVEMPPPLTPQQSGSVPFRPASLFVRASRLGDPNAELCQLQPIQGFGNLYASYPEVSQRLGCIYNMDSYGFYYQEREGHYMFWLNEQIGHRLIREADGSHHYLRNSLFLRDGALDVEVQLVGWQQFEGGVMAWLDSNPDYIFVIYSDQQPDAPQWQRFVSDIDGVRPADE